MRQLHTIVGLLVIVIFLLTGQYLEYYYPDMDESGIGEGTRMMLRSRHIYVLLVGLLNVSLGAYFVLREAGWRRYLQLTGSALLLVAAVLSVVAFFYEPLLDGLQRTLTLPSVVCAFAGTLIHMLSASHASEKNLEKKA
jgi:heme A synthase